MAINTTQYFRSAAFVTGVRYGVTNVQADVFSADATYLRDLTKLICINSSASAVDLTLVESDGTNNDIVHKITIPANSGNVVGAAAVKIIQDLVYQMPGCRVDAWGNYYFRLAPGKKLRALASTTAVLTLIGEIESFQQ